MSFRPNRMDAMPPVVKYLLLINGLLFALTYFLGSKGIDITSSLALYHYSSPDFKLWQPITHMFMHGGNIRDLESGFMHLFSNMFALWMFGSILEKVLGSKRFLTLYIICGIGASLIFTGVNTYEYRCLNKAIVKFDNNPTFKEYTNFLVQNHPNAYSPDDPWYQLQSVWETDPMNENLASRAMSYLDQYYKQKISVPCVGASGAVFGLLFAFGYLFPNTLLMLLFIPVPIKAKYFVAFYAAFELYAGLRNSAGDNIAHTAHLGGMIIAFLLLRLWQNSVHRNL